MTTPEQPYTDRAATAILDAVREEHDFGGWLAQVLATAAAELGSTAALTSSRPGSWEADLVQQLVRGTVGRDDDYLHAYAKEPRGSDDRALYAGRRLAHDDEICTCGRPAVLVLGNRWGGSGWCATNDLGPLDSHAAEKQRTELQTALARPLRHSDLATTDPPTTAQ
jgi:hypothetical protein